MVEKIFVDTNMFLYFLTRQEPYCTFISNLLDNSTSELITSVIVLNELKFKLLWTEASTLLENNHKYTLLKRVKDDKPLRERVLSRYLIFYLQLLGRFSILDYKNDDELSSCSLSTHYGLLPSDAAIVATMLRNNITQILTDDDDFKAVDKITVVSLNKM